MQISRHACSSPSTPFYLYLFPLCTCGVANDAAVCLRGPPAVLIRCMDQLISAVLTSVEFHRRLSRPPTTMTDHRVRSPSTDSLSGVTETDAAQGRPLSWHSDVYAPSTPLFFPSVCRTQFVISAPLQLAATFQFSRTKIPYRDVCITLIAN